MPYSQVPGARGVKQRPLSEALADPKMRFYENPDGSMDASREPGWLMKSLPYIIGGTMGYGALAGAGVLPSLGGGAASAGGGAAAGGVLPSSQLAMSPLYTGPVVGGSQGVSAGLGAAAGVGGATDYLGQKAATGSAGNVARAASQSSPWIQAALAALSGVPALIASRQNQPSADEVAMQQQIKDMLASQQRRTSYQDPLFQAVSQLAMSRLPTASQRPMGETL